MRLTDPLRRLQLRNVKPIPSLPIGGHRMRVRNFSRKPAVLAAMSIRSHLSLLALCLALLPALAAPAHAAQLHRVDLPLVPGGPVSDSALGGVAHPDPRHVAARRVLLDALQALAPMRPRRSSRALRPSTCASATPTSPSRRSPLTATSSLKPPSSATTRRSRRRWAALALNSRPQRVSDCPVEGHGRAYLIERELEQDGNSALQALLADYLDEAHRLDGIPMATSLLHRYLDALR